MTHNNVQTRQRSRSGAFSSSFSDNNRDSTRYGSTSPHPPLPPPSLHTSMSTTTSNPFSHAHSSTKTNTSTLSDIPNARSSTSTNTSTSITTASYSSTSQTQQSRPSLAFLRPGNGIGGNRVATRMRSGSNPHPPLYRDQSPSLALSETLYSQRRAHRESSDSSISSSTTGNDSTHINDSFSRSYLTEAGDNSNKHRASPGPSTTGEPWNGNGITEGFSKTRARASTSSGYNARDQGPSGVALSFLANSALSERLNTTTKAPSPVPSPPSLSPRTQTQMQSHSISVPSASSPSSRISSPSPKPNMTSSISIPNVPMPPAPRYSTKPILVPTTSTSTSQTSPANATNLFTATTAPATTTSITTTAANDSCITGTSATATLPSTNSTGPTTSAQSNGTSAVPTTTAIASNVDVVGKRLREQQLQDRFKAAQNFIERTVGQALPSSDLHESLKDGVILCRLANRLRPGTVEQISLKNLPFVKMENISNFLNAAKQLGVQSSDLFQTVDLYEGKDMNQVVSTILTLERVVGGVARIVAKEKRPGPNPLVSSGSASSQIPKATDNGAPLTRMRSKTAHTPSAVSLSSSSSMRSSSSSFYAAQIKKLEEDSIRFATGYDRLEIQQNLYNKLKDTRHQSTPLVMNKQAPSLPVKAKRSPRHRIATVGDIDTAVADISFGSDESEAQSSSQLETAEDRQRQRDLVFGSSGSPSLFEQTRSSLAPKSVSGPLFLADGSILTSSSSSAAATMDIAPSRRKKKSISLDPQVANAVIATPGYRNGLASPSSPLGLTQSSSYNAISNMTNTSPGGYSNLKQHSRYSSEKTNVTALEGLGSPVSSRSTTPVQGLRKSTNSIEPVREELELWENDEKVATYKLGNCIGRGQFGSVYKAMNMVTGQMVAVKRIKIDGLKDEERDMLMQEVDLLKSLAHPSIVKYEGFIKTEDYLNIVLEFVENGSLLTTLKSFGAFPEKLVVAYVVKILEGLVYLHGKEVVHCDLKAANILTTKNGNVKLSDFGVSLNLKVKESDFGAVAGTPNWMAPEVIELKGASPASDIWSLGCTIIEMLTGRPPYADLLAMTTLFRIVEDERPPLPSDVSADLLDFLCQCFQKDPALRPSAGDLGRHVWIKRNFAAKELKPMDSLPFMKRKLLEPKERVLASTQEEGKENGAAARRSLTPLGLSSGTATGPPPAVSPNVPLQASGSGRSTRRGSVDSAGAFYASSTVPAPTVLHDRYQEMNRMSGKATNQHQFVKSSFAKPVECRLCHDHVKKQAVICQDCSMVFHRKCQFYVGNTCFPGPHLSYFQSGTPVPSLPNLKVLANGKVKGGSRPSSRASQLNVDDRSRSATPSQGLSPRPCPTPPLSIFSKRETTTINESSEHSRVISPVPPLPLPQLPLTSVQRTMSPEGYLTHADPYNSQNQIQGQSMRPPSRQCDSPTSPTFSGLRNLISGGGRRFSFSKKGTSASNAHPLPTPPTSYSSNPTPSAVASPSVHVRQQAGTPDSSKTPRQPPTTPPKTLPVPITGNNNNNKVNLNDSAGRKYRGRLYHPGPGPLDPLDDNDINVIGHFSRSHQRPSSINIFSTSAPPVHTDYMAVAGRRLGAGAGVLGSRHSASSLKKYGDDEFDGNDEQEQKRVDSDDDDRNGHDGIDDMEEEDLEGMLIPSVARTPRSSVDAGHPVVVTNGGGHHRVNSHQSFGQALSHKQMQLSREPPSPPPRLPRSNIAAYHQNDFPRPHSGAKSPAMRSSLQQTQQSQQQPSLSGGGRSQLNSGYSSSGSSSAALTSSYSSTQSNNSSSASSLGSVAALLEEEERAMKEIQQQQYHSGGARSKNAMLNVPTGFHLATQPREAHHVGIRTMLNRFSASNKDHNNGYDRPLSVHDKEKEKETQLLQQHRDISNKSPLNAYNNINSMSTGAIKHQIQAPTQYQQLHGQALAGVRSIHPLQQQHQTRLPEARMSNSTEFDNIVGQRTKFAQGYELSHHQLEAANGTLLQNATNAWRASSPGGIHYSADSTSSSTILPPSSSSHANGLVGGGAEAALSALKRGRKVIRRSMGATLEKEHWD